MNDNIEFPERICVGEAYLESYLPTAKAAIERYGDHQFMCGLDVGLTAVHKLSSWLTSDPPMPHSDLRKYVIAEINSVLNKHRHRAPDKTY